MTAPSFLRPKVAQRPAEPMQSAVPDFLRPKVKKEEKLSPQKIKKEEPEAEENAFISAVRTVMQPVQGFLESTAPAIATGFWHLLAAGEMLNPTEIDDLERIAEREGVPFDREKYIEAAQTALNYIPTISNIASKIEQSTGFPLEPKTKLQKGLRLGGSAAGFAEGGLAQKAAAGVIAPTTANVLERAGAPETVAEIAGLGASGLSQAIPKKAPIIKPSGMTARQFENVKAPSTISSARLGKINQDLETDFKKISDKIILDSPIGSVQQELKANPNYVNDTINRFREVEKLAEKLPEKLHTDTLKRTIVDELKKTKIPGISASEYEKDFRKSLGGILKDIPSEEISAEALVRQYRKNNKALSETFDPSKSYAGNKAKKDALIEYNRAISKVIENEYPNTQFSNIFKETNKTWSEIKDAQAIDSYINGIFDGSVKYKQGRKFFENENVARPFKRALGDEGFKKFETLMTDMMTTETPMKMLKAAKSKGFGDLYSTAVHYILHPKLGMARAAYGATKGTYHKLMETFMDKPQTVRVWADGIKSLKKGDFVQANKYFNILDDEVKSIQESEVSPKKIK